MATTPEIIADIKAGKKDKYNECRTSLPDKDQDNLGKLTSFINTLLIETA
jgi:hypothetical protein